MNEVWVDGNALAATLREVFCFDMTRARVVCDGCGRRGPFAEVRVYTRAPGLVARCRGCDAVLLRSVQGPDRMWLELRGVRSVEVSAREVAGEA